MIAAENNTVQAMGGGIDLSTHEMLTELLHSNIEHKWLLTSKYSAVWQKYTDAKDNGSEASIFNQIHKGDL